MELRLEINTAGGRSTKADVTVRDEHGVILVTDRCDLASIEGRGKAAKNLCRRLQEKGIERAPDQIEKALEVKWSEFVQTREREEASTDTADDTIEASPEDVDAEAERLLAEMDADVRAEAEAMLRDPELLRRVVLDIEAQGVAGEKELGAALYLIGTSRLLCRPLAAMVKGPSSSGKSYVIEKVAGLFPPEVILLATQMTPQALFHMRPGALRHHWVVAGERSRKDDNDTAEATRALREMISSGRLSKLMPLKVGNELETILIEQEGPIAYVESTTLNTVFDEDENRCLSLFTDERKEQTRRIIDRLAHHCAGERVGPDAGRVVAVHHALQRLLRRREVVVPYAARLGKLIPDQRVEARRAFPHLLTMIQASALLHQFQRQSDEHGRVLADRDDYCLAARLLREPMRRLLGGGVGEPVRRFFHRLRDWFGDETFSSREARTREETSRSSVYGWLSELHKAGALEQLEAARGQTPARWRLADLDLDRAVGDILPPVTDLFEASSC